MDDALERITCCLVKLVVLDGFGAFFFPFGWLVAVGGCQECQLNGNCSALEVVSTWVVADQVVVNMLLGDC